MAYRTILAHFADEGGSRAVLTPALDLARRWEGHVLGLAVTPPYIFQPAYLPGTSSVVVDQHRKIFAEEAKRMRAAFEAGARDSGVSAEWVAEDAGLSPVWRRVVQYANAADLAVAAIPDWETSRFAPGDEQLALQIGRPVLFVPHSGDHAGFGKRILVAWNGARESARAAFDSLPLLKRAELVKVVWINPDEGEGPEGSVPAADLCTALARHKVACEAAQTSGPDSRVGALLLDEAHKGGCDLLVMGCYGHARLREMVLGGATRDILRSTTIPVLMSH